MLAVPFVDELASGVAPAAAPDVGAFFHVDGATAASASLVAFHVLAFFVEPALLAWAERVRARWFSSASLAVLACACFLAALGANRWLFLFALALYGPASGCALAVSEGLLVEASPEERERTMARVSLAGVAGDVAVPLLLALVSALGFDWRATFVVAGVVAALLAAAHASSRALDRRFSFHDDEDDEPTLSWRETLIAALRHRALVAWSFAAATATFLDEIFVAFGVVHLDALGASTNARSLAVGAWVVGGAIGLFALERVVARIDAKGLLFVACGVTVAALVTIVVVRSTPLAIVAFFFVGAAGSTLHPLSRARCYAALPGRPALVHAVASVFAPIDLLAPIPLGLLAAHFHAWSAIAAILFAPIVIALVAARTAPRP